MSTERQNYIHPNPNGEEPPAEDTSYPPAPVVIESPEEVIIEVEEPVDEDLKGESLDQDEYLEGEDSKSE